METSVSNVCPICGVGKTLQDKETITFGYKGVVLSADRDFSYCDECGVEFVDPKTAASNSKRILKVQLAHDGLLQGHQITAIRERYRLTKKSAAELFGGGAIAFSKYEADEIAHTVAIDRLLRIIDFNPANLLKLADIANVKLEPRTVASIKASFQCELESLWQQQENEISFLKIETSLGSGHSCANDAEYFDFLSVEAEPVIRQMIA